MMFDCFENRGQYHFWESIIYSFLNSLNSSLFHVMISYQIGMQKIKTFNAQTELGEINDECIG